MKLRFGPGATFLSPLLLLLAQPRSAEACGGCFLQGPMSTAVTAHRMAYATSKTRTVLWDQIAYAGNPAEFSWVLPVRGAVTLEAANDAWFETLETVTNTRVSPPQLNCYSRNSGGGSCGSGDSVVPPSVGAAGRGDINPGEGVMVTHEGTVGPYSFVELTATSSMSLVEWLRLNGYAVPADIEPLLATYTQEGFGFLALKLRPGLGTQQMTPVRVITEGAGNSLPLRMVAAGTGPFVAITLYLIGEGRYDVRGFEHASIDASRLTWNWATRQSNYADLRAQALTASNGRVWLTSFAEPQAFTRSYSDALNQLITFNVTRSSGAPVSFGDLAHLYFAQGAANANSIDVCSGAIDLSAFASTSPVVDDCKSAPGDAGAPRADGGALPPPSAKCDPVPAGAIGASTLACNGLSDIAAAMIGMHPSDVWVTRVEANLPREALAGDLIIQPADRQEPVANVRRAAVHQNPPCDLLENHPEVTEMRSRGSVSHRAGVGLLSGIALFFARRIRRARHEHESR